MDRTWVFALVVTRFLKKRSTGMTGRPLFSPRYHSGCSATLRCAALRCVDRDWRAGTAGFNISSIHSTWYDRYGASAILDLSPAFISTIFISCLSSRKKEERRALIVSFDAEIVFSNGFHAHNRPACRSPPPSLISPST